MSQSSLHPIRGLQKKMDQIVIGSVGAVISNLYRAVIGQTYEYLMILPILLRSLCTV